MDAIRGKNMFPTTWATYHIAPIRLHKDIRLRGSLYIVKRGAYRSTFCLSSERVFCSA